MQKLLLLLTLGLLYGGQVQTQTTAAYAADQLIVNFKTAPVPVRSAEGEVVRLHVAAVDALNATLGVTSLQLIGNRKAGDTYLLTFGAAIDMARVQAQYMRTGLLGYVEPNYIGSGGGQKGVLQTIPTDTYFYRQYGLHNDGTFSLLPAVSGADIKMDLGWDIEQGDASIVVAILDSGTKLDHPELAGRIWTNAGEVPNETDTDSNGYVDDTQGWDFANDDNDPSDDHGHGTNVSGIVAANGDNATGYAGVDWHCRLMPCKILNDNNFGYYSWWADAIYYAVDNGARVISMSVGGSGNSTTLENAVDYAYNNDVTVVACMMNENGIAPYYPAAFANTIAVGSTDANDDRSAPFFWSAVSGSNFGSHIDVVAPGNYIYGLSRQSNTNYDTYWGGTSQATPLVTGLAALLLAQDATRTPADIRQLLRSTADDQVGNAAEDTPGFDIYFGYGRINAFAALSALMVAADEAVPTDGVVVHPNPAVHQVVLTHTDRVATVQMLDVAGRLLARHTVLPGTPTLTLEIATYPAGLYWLRLLDADQQPLGIHKLVIEK